MNLENEMLSTLKQWRGWLYDSDLTETGRSIMARLLKDGLVETENYGRWKKWRLSPEGQKRIEG